MQNDFCSLPLECRGVIFWGAVVRYMKVFLLGNYYINTNVENAGISGFPVCLSAFRYYL